MWKNYKTLNRISRSIAGYHEGNKYSAEIFKTSAGEIELCDEGEFGGYLKIGEKVVCNGNFSQIFEYKGEKYVIDDLKHMACYHFRLIQVNDNGTINILYDADDYAKLHREYDSKIQIVDQTDADDEKKHSMRKAPSPEEIERYKLNYNCSVGLDTYYIGMDSDGIECVFFLCSGLLFDLSKNGSQRYKKIQYLLKYNPEDKKRPFVRIDLPEDKVDYNAATSIWTDGKMLVIGDDKQVVTVVLSDMRRI